jgi:glutathione S-transferase
MYRLYGSNGSGSASVEAALALCGAAYEVVATTTREGKHLTPEYAAINPRQQVPALALPDGSVMTEGAAMMLHLADAFAAAHLAPLPGSASRAQHDRWLIFMAVNIYEGELRKGYSERYGADADSIRACADAYVERHYHILEQAIAGPFLLGMPMTMADLYLWMLAGWMEPEWLARECPKVAAIAAAVSARPELATIHATHFG